MVAALRLQFVEPQRHKDTEEKEDSPALKLKRAKKKIAVLRLQ